MSDDIDVKGEADRLTLVCQALESVNLDGLIAEIERASAFGPFVDPTAYREMLHREGNMLDVIDLARAAQPLQNHWRETVAKLGIEVPT